MLPHGSSLCWAGTPRCRRAPRTTGTPCPASGYPLTVKVSVSVKRTDTNIVLTTASTLVFVTGP